MENIFLGVQKCSTDGKYTFISISDAFLAFTGYTREEIRDRFHSSFCEMAMPEDASIIQQTLATRTKPAFSYNYRVVAKTAERSGCTTSAAESRKATRIFIIASCSTRPPITI